MSRLVLRSAVVVVLVACLLLCLACVASAASDSVAYVRTGAFVLESSPTFEKDDGSLRYRLIGYLPMGTIVYLDATSKRELIHSFEREKDEEYLYVESDIGVSGLVLANLVIAIREQMLVPNGDCIVKVYTTDSELGQLTLLRSVTRWDGGPMLVLDDGDPNFIDVELPLIGSSTDAPERGRVPRAYRDRGDLITLDPSTTSEDISHVTLGDAKPSVGQGAWSRLVTYVSSKTGQDQDAVWKYFGDPDHVRCVCDGETKGKLGFDIYGSGLSIEYGLQLKQRGVLTDVTHCSYLRGDNLHKGFFGVKVVECKQGTPYRMVHYVLLEDAFDEERRVNLWAHDLPDTLVGSWSASFAERAASRKMIRVAGWYQYQRALRFLLSMASGNYGYLTELSPRDRLVVCNLILSDIAYFARIDDFEKPRTAG